MILKSIHLKNFQSHIDSKITFHSGVNVITGPSDQGKSSVIRALRWVLYNQPKGGDIVTLGKNSCSVTVELEDGTSVTRQRSKGTNKYIVNKDGEVNTYTSISGDVLRLVQSALRISPVF